MTGLNHAATGAVVAVVFKEPFIALPAALMSHFVVDGLPHWNYWVPGQKHFRQWVIFSDMLFSLVLLATLGLGLAGDNWWLVIACGLLAILPDMMWLPYLILGRKTPAGGKSLLHRLRRFHLKIQWSETSFGLAIELLWFATMLQLFLLFVD